MLRHFSFVRVGHFGGHCMKKSALFLLSASTLFGSDEFEITKEGDRLIIIVPTDESYQSKRKSTPEVLEETSDEEDCFESASSQMQEEKQEETDFAKPNDSCEPCAESCITTEPCSCCTCNDFSFFTPTFDPCGLFVQAEFLYWYAKEKNLPLAMETSTLATVTNFQASVPVKQYFTSSIWDPGVRVQVGWEDFCSCWDLSFIWTWYKNKNRDRISTPAVALSEGLPLLGEGTKTLVSPWVYSNISATQLAQVFNKIQGRWKLYYNLFDIEMGRSWEFDCHFLLRPYFGVRVAWTEIEFALKQLNTSDQNANLVKTQDQYKTKYKNWFTGAGFFTGLEPTWFFSPCFGLYGSFEFALLWGKEKARRTERILLDNPFALFEKYRMNSSDRGMRWMTDMELGFRYVKSFCCDQYTLKVDLGWEHQLWNHFVKRSQIGNATSINKDFSDGNFQRFFRKMDEVQTDLSLGGFVLKGQWSF